MFVRKLKERRNKNRAIFLPFLYTKVLQSCGIIFLLIPAFFHPFSQAVYNDQISKKTHPSLFKKDGSASLFYTLR